MPPRTTSRDKTRNLKDKPQAQLTVERLGAGADGVGHLPSGKTIFVPLSCPGDRLLVAITEEHERFARGEIIEITEASPARVAPRCPFFGECGGCDWQQVDYATQLQAKQTAVIDALTRIGGIEQERIEALVAECVASPREYGYRNKIELNAHFDGTLHVGYKRRASGSGSGAGGRNASGASGRNASGALIEVDSCPLMKKRWARAPRSLRGSLRFLSGGRDLGLTRVALRASNESDKLEVALYTLPGAFPRAQAATLLGEALGRVTSVVRVLLGRDGNTRRSSKTEVLSGKGYLPQKLGDWRYLVSAESFWQVNTDVAEKLVAAVVAAIEPEGTDCVLDLYAGTGTFTLPLAAAAGAVIALESCGPAVRDLRRNLEANGLEADVVGGDAAYELGLLQEGDKLVVDPPRAGLDPLVSEAICAQERIKRMVYVSCDPATLARDLKVLTQSFDLVSVQPFDMFPQTHHVECVTLMSRAKE